jgi:hypothetical protein
MQLLHGRESNSIGDGLRTQLYGFGAAPLYHHPQQGLGAGLAEQHPALPILARHRLYGDGIHLTIAHKREWSYGFKPDNKTVPLPCYLESPYDHQRESSTS